MVPAARGRLHRSYADGAAFLHKEAKLDCRKSCQTSGGKALASSLIHLQKASKPAPNLSCPKSVLVIDSMCEKRRPSLPAPDCVFRESDLEGDLRVEFFLWAPLGTAPSESEAFASTAAAAASETEV